MTAIRQAGVIAARIKGVVPEFLLVTARSKSLQWIFPKGYVEPGETLEATGLRELQEEAGVEATVVGFVGASRYAWKNEDIEVSYFLAMAQGDDDGDSPEGRQLRWLPYAEAQETVTFDDAKRLLENAKRLLESR